MRSSLLRVVAVAAGVALAALAVPTAVAGSPDPAVGDPADAVTAGRTVVPLRGAVPDWFTPELAAAVDAADGQPVAAPTDAPLPGTVGIRPGSWMISPAGCTMNFVFGNGGDFAIGTAGHCVDGVGDEVTLLTLAPGTENPVLVEIGAVLSRVVGPEDEVRAVFALVSIRPELNEWVSPTIGVIAGPCGQYGGEDAVPVLHYGHGLAIGTGGTPRAGLALYYEPDTYSFAGTAIFGDSGSAVRTADLPAIGNLTHIIVDTSKPGATAAGTRIATILQHARGWSLLDSPLCSGSSGDGGDGSGEDGSGGDGSGGGGNDNPKRRGPQR